MIDISGIPKPRLLASLYNNSKAIGIGKYQYNKNHSMTYREAEKYLQEQSKFTLLIGRVIYMDFSKDEIDETTYDKYIGKGKVQSIVNKIKK